MISEFAARIRSKEFLNWDNVRRVGAAAVLVCGLSFFSKGAYDSYERFTRPVSVVDYPRPDNLGTTYIDQTTDGWNADSAKILNRKLGQAEGFDTAKPAYEALPLDELVGYDFRELLEVGLGLALISIGKGIEPAERIRAASMGKAPTIVVRRPSEVFNVTTLPYRAYTGKHR